MKINILGIPYEVVEVDTIDKSVRIFGHIDYPNQIIKLEKGMGKQYREQTLLHEIVHGIFEGLGYDDLNADEEKVQGIASVLYQVLSSALHGCDLTHEY